MVTLKVSVFLPSMSVHYLNIPLKNVVKNNSQEETISLFISILRFGVEPDDFTYGSVMKACTGQLALKLGMGIHGLIIKSGMGLKSFTGSAILDMYWKCGKVEEVKKLHGRMVEQTIVSWDAIISGFSLLGQSEEAQEFFSKMLEIEVSPDNFTYTTVFDACSNLATVALGKQIHAQIIKQELLGDAFITSTLVDMYSTCGSLQDGVVVFEKSLGRDFVTLSVMLYGKSISEGTAEVKAAMWSPEVEKAIPFTPHEFLAVLLDISIHLPSSLTISLIVFQCFVP